MATYKENEVPSIGLYPAGTFGFKVVSATHSDAGDPTRIQVQVQFVGVPEDAPNLLGLKYTERYTLGTEDDPDAEGVDTKKKGLTGMHWGRYHALVKTVGLFAGNTEEEVAALNSDKPEFTAHMACKGYTSKDTGEFKGPFNNLDRFFAPGKKEPKLDPVRDEDPSQPKPTTSTAPASAGTPSAASETEHCDVCDKSVPRRLAASHAKRHQADAARDEDIPF